MHNARARNAWRPVLERYNYLERFSLCQFVCQYRIQKQFLIRNQETLMNITTEKTLLSHDVRTRLNDIKTTVFR